MKVSFFSSNSGRCYVGDFIDALMTGDQAAILAVLKDVETYGLSAVGCQIRQIEGKLWEIKIKGKRLRRRNWKWPAKDSKRCCHEKENSK